MYNKEWRYNKDTEKMAKIMVVDDEVNVRYLIKRKMETEGHKVIEAGSGAECLKLLKKRPDIILLDIMMPKMDGIQVLDSIRKRDADIPIIIITAYGSEKLASQAIHLGADDYITKPLDLNYLTLVIKDKLEKANLKKERREYYKRLEAMVEEIKRTKDFLNSIIESSLDSIITTDLKGNITSFSKGAEKTLGYTAREMIGRSILDLYPKKLRDQGAWPKILLKGEEIKNKTVKMVDKKGRHIDISLSLSLMRNSSGNPIGTVGVGRDITKERRLEQQLLQSDKLASIGQLASGVAHEINNPLGNISLYALLLREDILEGKPRVEDIEVILEQIEAASKIVSDLLDFSHQYRPAFLRVDVNETINKTLRVVDHQLSVNGITVEKKLAKNLPEIRGDIGKLQQVFLNLIVNAFQAMPDGGKLTLITRKENNRVYVWVKDTGIGIPEKHLSKIFDPFFTTKPVGEGTGLGLSVTHGIVKEHKGEITVDSKVGVGTTFKITFPIE